MTSCCLGVEAMRCARGLDSSAGPTARTAARSLFVTKTGIPDLKTKKLLISLLHKGAFVGSSTSYTLAAPGPPPGVKKSDNCRARCGAPDYTWLMFLAVSVRPLRERLGLDEASFARVVGVDVRTVARWESGERQPKGAPASVMAALQRSLDERPDSASEIVDFIVRAAAIGGLAYILVKLLERLDD